MTAASTLKDSPERHTIVSAFSANESDDQSPEPEPTDEPENEPVQVQIGSKFNRLTVVADAGEIDGHRYLVVKCDCSRLRVIKRSKLITGHTKQCSTCSTPRKKPAVSTDVLLVHGKKFQFGREQQ
jgi:hypothetical protein